MRGGTNKDAEIAGSSANALILRQSIRESKNYLYLPALAEVNTDINAATTTVPYFNNELTTSLNLSSYPLFGGNDGLKFYRMIFENAHKVIFIPRKL